MRIKCAAIRTKSGQIFEGKSHSECYKSLKSAGIDRLVSLRSDNGFMTECGKFVDRREAAKIAFEAGQIKEIKTDLFSEDLNRS